MSNLVDDRALALSIRPEPEHLRLPIKSILSLESVLGPRHSMANRSTVRKWLRSLKGLSNPALRSTSDKLHPQGGTVSLPISATEPIVQIEPPLDDNLDLDPESVNQFKPEIRASSPAGTDSTVDTDPDAYVEHLVKALSAGVRWISETTNDANVSQIKGLLGLPYELRIDIYRYTLLKSGTISIDTSIPSEPPLLAVNKQIRVEASEVYYGENKFAGHIFHFDSAIYLKWRHLSRFEPCYSTCKWRVRSSHNWANLKAWMKADFEDDSQDLSITVREEGKTTVDVGAFGLMRKLKGERKSWEEIEPYLEHVLEILIGTDNKRWKRNTG